MLYMIIERFRDGDPLPVYRRLRDEGRLVPQGLRYVASWVTEVIPVVTSAEAGSHRRPSTVKPLRTVCPGDPFACYLEAHGLAAAGRPARPDRDRLVGTHRDQVLRRLFVGLGAVVESKHRPRRRL